MWIVNLEANPNGSHNDHRADHITTVPDGWAMIPDDFPVPSTFPFVGIEAEDVTFYREVEVGQEVTKERDTGMVDEDGNPIMETYTEMETVTEEREYTMLTVTEMTEGTLPEPEPEPEPTKTTEERLFELETSKANQSDVDELTEALELLLSGDTGETEVADDEA